MSRRETRSRPPRLDRATDSTILLPANRLIHQATMSGARIPPLNVPKIGAARRRLRVSAVARRSSDRDREPQSAGRQLDTRSRKRSVWRGSTVPWDGCTVPDPRLCSPWPLRRSGAAVPLRVGLECLRTLSGGRVRSGEPPRRRSAERRSPRVLGGQYTVSAVADAAISLISVKTTAICLGRERGRRSRREALATRPYGGLRDRPAKVPGSRAGGGNIRAGVADKPENPRRNADFATRCVSRLASRAWLATRANDRGNAPTAAHGLRRTADFGILTRVHICWCVGTPIHLSVNGVQRAQRRGKVGDPHRAGSPKKSPRTVRNCTGTYLPTRAANRAAVGLPTYQLVLHLALR